MKIVNIQTIFKLEGPYCGHYDDSMNELFHKLRHEIIFDCIDREPGSTWLIETR